MTKTDTAGTYRTASAAVVSKLFCVLIAALAPDARAATTTFVDISPDNEGPSSGFFDCPDPCASGRNGGRVNGLAGVPGDSSTYFAASELGGLFKSTDGGQSWSHLDGHVPTQTWDVAAAPGGQRVFATSFYDGRVNPLTGFEMSKDGGTTWNHPLVSALSTCSSDRARQPSGFGIALRPGSQDVFVGTNCGIARSPDAGDSWAQFDPTPGDGIANSVWDVVALPGGRTYACGDDGLLTSPDGHIDTWKMLDKPSPFPGGYCSLAVSPEDPSVVFVVFDTPKSYGELFGTGKGGVFYEVHIDYGPVPPTVLWTSLPYPDYVKPGFSIADVKGRVPFVATNKRSQGFDLWLGDGSLWRVPCAAQRTAGCVTGSTCSTDTSCWAGSFSDHEGDVQDAHGDSGDLEFDPTASTDACPTLYSSDGGIHRNTKDASSDCETPTFSGANLGMHAFMIWDMAGVKRPGESEEEIYIGTQDNGLFYTGNAGVPDPVATPPKWTHGVGGDMFDVEADSTRVVASVKNLIIGDPGFTQAKVVASGFANPDVDIPEYIAQAGPGQYMLAISAPGTFTLADNITTLQIPTGVRLTNDIKGNPLGSALGIWPPTPTALSPCHIRVGIGPDGPQPYVLAGPELPGQPRGCLWPRTDFTPDQLWTYRGANWTQIQPPPEKPGNPVLPGAGFGLIAVDPVNPERLYASVVLDGPPRIMRSLDGGLTWDEDQQLTGLMSGGGKFVDYPKIVGDGIFPYLTPLFVAFDPEDANILVAGGSYSGVFLSSDGGNRWSLLTDPFTPGLSGIPHLPRPMFAHFDHDKTGFVKVYLGTGRGVWRVDLAASDLSVTKSDSPDPVVTGSELTYSISVSNDGPNPSASITLTDGLPEGLAFQSLTAAAGWSCLTPPVGGGGQVTCTRSDLPPGTTDPFTLVAKVDCSLADSALIMNSADITTSHPDPTLDNNTSSATTLVSNPPPAVTCPADIEVECTEDCGIKASDPQLVPFFTGVFATDNCPGVVITNDAPQFFGLGATSVNFTATDGGGAAASCAATVKVVDTTPPQIRVTLNRDDLWPPNHKLGDIEATVSVTDICDPHPSFVLTSITSSEPEDSLGDGDTPDDIQGDEPGTPDVAFRLRSERSGQGPGRIYTIVYTATDKSGNTAQATATVQVPHDQSGGASGGSGFNSSGTAFAASAQTFELVIVSTSSFDARRVDPKPAQVGNTTGVTDTMRSRTADVNGDKMADLILVYSVAEANRLKTASDGSAVAFRYGTLEGAYFLVEDIFRLGKPMTTKR